VIFVLKRIYHHTYPAVALLVDAISAAVELDVVAVVVCVISVDVVTRVVAVRW